MRRFPAVSVFLALWLFAAAFPAFAAPASVEAKVRARQRAAQVLAGKGQWNAAFQTLAAARDLINAERHKAKSPARPPLSPALRKEARALSSWLASKKKGRKPGEPLPVSVVKEYQRRQQAIRQKAAKLAPPKQNAAASRQASLRLGLLLADVDDTAAGIHQKKGDTAEATASRLEAGRRRLKLYSEAGKKTEAGAWAGKLAKLGVGDPVSLAAVAEYHQGSKRFGPAADYWRRAIGIREKDSSARSASESQLYYRQLAYCYDRLGKPAERDAARAAAARLEAAHAPRSKTR